LDYYMGGGFKGEKEKVKKKKKVSATGKGKHTVFADE